MYRGPLPITAEKLPIAREGLPITGEDLPIARGKLPVLSLLIPPIWVPGTLFLDKKLSRNLVPGTWALNCKVKNVEEGKEDFLFFIPPIWCQAPFFWIKNYPEIWCLAPWR
jgi:hypothetical protein